MWFKRFVDSAAQTESDGEVLEEINEGDSKKEMNNSGDMPASETKTDEISADYIEPKGEILEEIPEEELMNETGDTGDMPNPAAGKHEISPDDGAQSFMLAQLDVVMRWIFENKGTIIIYTACILLSYSVFVAMRSPKILFDRIEINVTKLCPSNGTKCNVTYHQDPLFEGLRVPYKTLFSFESPYQGNELPEIAMAMTCRHQDCEKKDSGYLMPTTAKCIRRVCKCGYNTTEFHPVAACNNLYDSCAAQFTASYGFDCDNDEVFRYGYNTTGFQADEPLIDVCDACAALLTLSFGFDCSEDFSKYGTSTTEFQSAEMKENQCDSCGTQFIQPFEIECDDKVFSGEVEALLSEAVGNVSIRVSTSIAVERKGSMEKKTSDKHDDTVDGSKTTANTEL